MYILLLKFDEKKNYCILLCSFINKGKGWLNTSSFTVNLVVLDILPNRMIHSVERVLCCSWWQQLCNGQTCSWRQLWEINLSGDVEWEVTVNEHMLIEAVCLNLNKVTKVTKTKCYVSDNNSSGYSGSFFTVKGHWNKIPWPNRVPLLAVKILYIPLNEPWQW